jgi:hypothetical protein
MTDCLDRGRPMYLPIKPRTVAFRFAVLGASCALLALQIWIEYDYYHDRGWEMTRGLRLDAFLNGILSPWLPAALSFVLLGTIIFSLLAWRRLGRTWSYAIVPTIAIFTTLLVRLLVPAFHLWNIV